MTRRVARVIQAWPGRSGGGLEREGVEGRREAKDSETMGIASSVDRRQ